MRLSETVRGWCAALKSKREQLRDAGVIASQRRTIEDKEQSIADSKTEARLQGQRIAELEDSVDLLTLERDKLLDICTRDRERVLAETATMTNRVMPPNVHLSLPQPTEQQNVA